MKGFCHLHVHTQFSLLDGAIRFEDLFGLARQYRMDACAITDHGTMFGAADFYFTAKEWGIKPIIGCEAYITPRSRFEKKGKGEDNAYHVVLLAMTDKGYKNLIKLASYAQLEGFYYVPRIDRELLRSYNEGLICLTACIKGEIPNQVLKGEHDKAKEIIEEYYSIFNERLYLELQDNGLPEQKKVNEGLIALSKYYGIPIVATNDCHYLKKEEAKAHELLLCIQTGKTITDKDRLSFKSDEFYFKSIEELEVAFSNYPEALANTLKIAEMCNLEIPTGEYHFPEFRPPEGKELNLYLEELCIKGLEKRMEGIEPQKGYLDRLHYELDVIKKTGFAGYFLIVADFINYAKENHIPVGPGRGSAAGSLVAYALGITDIDPIKYDLIFERFLNPERISMPDIDVDFCKEGRDSVIRYVTEKYGKDNVAQIITFGTMQSKAVVRDVGRALGMPYSEVDRIAKLIPTGNIGIRGALQEEPRLKELYEKTDRVRELLDNASLLEGLARHASTHAAGIVIANKPLTEHLPLYRGQKGETVTQYPMKTIEQIGLIKIDFLGLETLTLIDNVIRLLKSEGIHIDISKIPLDDEKTYELLSSGNTSGVFQLESRGMRELLTKLRPSKFEDIMPLIALYRPGPLKSGMVDEFIKRKNNPSLVRYETPLLEEVLHDTYGVIVYQEQIMKIASRLANFSLKEADALRKAISKKNPEVLERYREQFIKGARENGVKPNVAERIYGVVLRFGEYGFNKSHSTAYGLIAYQTAYLKAHYPVHYMTAMLTSEVNNTDKLIKYITECRDSGIEILPPDINESNKPFTISTISKRSIRYGLSGIKNVGDAAIDHILEIRQGVGGFNSFTQFISLIDSRKVNKKVLESLAKAGCFDSLGLKRSQVLYIIKGKTEAIQKRPAKTSYKQMAIFGTDAEDEQRLDVPDMEELPHEEVISGEKEAFGFYFTKHPLDSYTELIDRLTKLDSQKLKELDITGDVDIAGIVNGYREITTKRGDKMAYITLEDTKGIIEAIVFPDILSKNRDHLKGDRPIILKGQVERSEDGTVKIRTKEIRLLEEQAETISRGKMVRLKIDCERFELEGLRRLKDVLLGLTGSSMVSIEFRANGRRRSMELPELRIDHNRLDILQRHFKDGLDYEVMDEVLP